MAKNLIEIHEDVPANHYDVGIKNNFFQKFWHSRRFSEVKNVAILTNGRILDVGCHAGMFTKVILNKTGSKAIYGIDISPQAIILAKKRIPYGKFKVGNASNISFKDNYFEVVYCLEALEHIDDPEKAISEIHRVLNKKGHAVFLVPTDNKLFRIVWLIWTLYYPVWRHAHVNSFNGNNLEKVLQKARFKIIFVKTFNLGMLKIVVVEK